MLIEKAFNHTRKNNIFNVKLEKPLINYRAVNGSPVRLHLFNLIIGALNISRVCPFRGSSTCFQAYCGTFWTSMSNLRYLLIRSQILNSFKKNFFNYEKKVRTSSVVKGSFHYCLIYGWKNIRHGILAAASTEPVPRHRSSSAPPFQCIVVR